MSDPTPPTAAEPTFRDLLSAYAHAVEGAVHAHGDESDTDGQHFVKAVNECNHRGNAVLTAYDALRAELEQARARNESHKKALKIIADGGPDAPYKRDKLEFAHSFIGAIQQLAKDALAPEAHGAESADGTSVAAVQSLAALLTTARAELAQARAEVDSVQAIIDLMRDEFKRIKALCINELPHGEHESASMGEIIGLCERAVTNIHQHVPVVVQRDDAERARNEARRERDNAVERLAAFRRHVEGAPTLASIVEQANGFRMLDFVRFVDGDDYTVTELIARPTLAPEPDHV